MSFLDILILLPELFFINITLILLWVGLYLRYKWPILAFNGETFCFFTIYLISFTLVLLANAPFSDATALLNNFIVTEFETALKLFTLIVSVILLLSILSTEKALSSTFTGLEVSVVRLLIIVSMLFLISVNDLIYLFFILELYALCSYVLVGYRGKVSVFSAEAPLKYFLLGTVFSILMCYSFAIIYLSTGLTNFSSLELYLSLFNTTAFVWQGYDIFYPAISLLLVTFFFKLAAAPFHFWSPDVYDGAPTNTTYFLFVVPKIALLAILVKLSFLWVGTISLVVLLFTAALSLVVGAVGGLFQKRVKRLLTYSMINNNGFFLLALATNSVYGFVFMFFFLFIYTFSLLGLFSSLNSLRFYNTLSSLKNFWSWINLFFINKVQSITTGLLLFSSAGIPPLVGFISKFFILFSLLAGFGGLIYLLLLALILAPLTCFYYIRIIKVMSFSKKNFWLFLKPISNTSAYVISAMTVSLFLLFWSSGLIINIILLLFI